MASNQEKQFLLECIEVYRKHPVLWNIKSTDYSNRRMKEEAYGVLVTKFKEKYPTWGKDEVKKKMNSFRTNFRKELKKVMDSKKSGAGSEDVYEPTLWYYNALLFLIDQEQPSASRNSIETEENDELEEQIQDETETEDIAHHEPPTTPAPTTPGRTTPGPVPSKSTPKSRLRDTRKGKLSADQELMDLACKRLREPDNVHLALAKTWADELSKMSPNQQLFAKKGINDILFEGQMGTLRRDSVKINQMQQFISRPGTPYNSASGSSYNDNRPDTPYSTVSEPSYSRFSEISNPTPLQAPDESSSALAHYFCSFEP